MNEKFDWSQDAFTAALKANDVESLRRCLDGDCTCAYAHSVNDVYDDLPLLCWAANEGEEEIVKFLLAEGVDVDIRYCTSSGILR